MALPLLSVGLLTLVFCLMILTIFFCILKEGLHLPFGQLLFSWLMCLAGMMLLFQQFINPHASSKLRARQASQDASQRAHREDTADVAGKEKKWMPFHAWKSPRAASHGCVRQPQHRQFLLYGSSDSGVSNNIVPNLV